MTSVWVNFLCDFMEELIRFWVDVDPGREFYHLTLLCRIGEFFTLRLG